MSSVLSKLSKAPKEKISPMSCSLIFYFLLKDEDSPVAAPGLSVVMLSWRVNHSSSCGDGTVAVNP